MEEKRFLIICQSALADRIAKLDNLRAGLAEMAVTRSRGLDLGYIERERDECVKALVYCDEVMSGRAPGMGE